MSYSCNIVDWFALAAGLASKESWQAWAQQQYVISEQEALLPKYKRLPMMMARRMSVASLLAVEVALAIFEKNPIIDAAVFVSRHGEVERTTKIIQNIISQLEVSPTDFAMSVHNTTAGIFTIASKQEIPITSLSAGVDSFQQAMYEVQGMLAAGLKQVLLVDFDGHVPSIYHSKLENYQPNLVYALGLLITKGDDFICQESDVRHSPLTSLPQSLIFLNNYLNNNDSFSIVGQYASWQWSRKL